jgi:hypothetical protein
VIYDVVLLSDMSLDIHGLFSIVSLILCNKVVVLSLREVREART